MVVYKKYFFRAIGKYTKKWDLFASLQSYCSTLDVINGCLKFDVVYIRLIYGIFFATT